MAHGVVEQSDRSGQPAAPSRRAWRRSLSRPRLLVGAFAVALVAGVAIGLRLLHAGALPEASAIATLQAHDYHSLAFSPEDPNVVFFGHHNGIMRSDDGGRTWQPLVVRPNFDAMSLAVGRTNPRRMYLAGHNVFQVSDDGGTSWQPLANTLPDIDIHGFALSPDDPSRLYACVAGYGLWRSDDGGRTWHRPGSQLPGDVVALAAAGGSPETLYAGSARSGVLQSADGGRTWAPIAALGSRGAFALAVDPTHYETVYAGVEGGLFKSTDGGATWSRLPFPVDNALAIAASPARPGLLLAIAFAENRGLVFRSEDGGASWGGGS